MERLPVCIMTNAIALTAMTDGTRGSCAWADALSSILLAIRLVSANGKHICSFEVHPSHGVSPCAFGSHIFQEDLSLLQFMHHPKSVGERASVAGLRSPGPTPLVVGWCLSFRAVGPASNPTGVRCLASSPVGAHAVLAPVPR